MTSFLLLAVLWGIAILIAAEVLATLMHNLGL